MNDIQIDKTFNHFHTDPKLISQEDCANYLKLGQFVYLDNNGFYYPALSQKDYPFRAIVVGVVWQFEGKDQFYLKCEPGPLYFRFPNYNSNSIPGKNGCILYTSDIIPGGVTDQAPEDVQFIIGYKTNYGILFRPERITI